MSNVAGTNLLLFRWQRSATKYFVKVKVKFALQLVMKAYGEVEV